MSIIVTSATKYLKETFRNRARLGILILSPIIFFSFFGFIFTTEGNSSIIRTIGIIDEDTGFTGSFTDAIPDEFLMENSHSTLSGLYLDLFANHTSLLTNTEISVDIIIYENRDELIDDIETQNINLGVIFPQQFTNSILDGINKLANQTLFQVDARSDPLIIETYGDPSTEPYQTALSMVTQSLEKYISGFVGIDSLYQVPPSGGYLSYAEETVESETFSQIDFFIPGFLVFLIILQAINISGALAYEKETGTITRLKLSKMYSWELFSGVTIGQTIAFTIQFLISIVVLTYWGIDLNLMGWFRVYLLSLFTNFNMIGLSLIIAAYSRKVSDAMSITGIGSAPLGFLSGSFLEVPDAWIIKSINLQFWDLVPTYHATKAITGVIIDNKDLADVFGNVIALVIYSIVLFFLGILAFNRKVIKSDI